MESRRRTYRPRSQPSPVRRVLAVLVLAGYALVLAGSSAGQGWHLLAHLLSTHHGDAHEADMHEPVPADVQHTAPPVTVEVEHPGTPEHSHGAEHRHTSGAGLHPHHHHAAHQAGAASEAAEPQRDVRPERAPHEHGGRTHTHESADPDPDVPVLLTLSLDKHCLFAGAALPPPPVRDCDTAPLAAALFSTVSPVEVPPPRLMG